MIARVIALAASVGLAACAPTPENTAASLSYVSTADLCSRHMSASGMDLLAIEAELGARGALQCRTAYGTTSYVGSKTGGTVGRALYARPASASEPAPSNDRDCSDFASSGEAQRFFIAAGGPHRDPHRLDADGDGNACEWGAALSRSVSLYKPKPVRVAPVRAAPRSSSSRCYVGPRGGTYTITASGNRNYDGC